MLKPIINAWQIPVKEIEKLLETDLQKGLSESEVANRLTLYGLNILGLHQEESLWKLLLQQFISPLVWILAIASGFAFAFQEWLEGFAILGVILINALIVFFMEWQAVRSMEALRNLAQSNANVIRDGNLIKEKSSHLTL